MEHPEAVEVVVRNVPTATYLAARRHIERIADEARALRASGVDLARPEVEVALAVADVLDATDLRARSTAAVQAAYDAGEATTDVRYEVSSAAGVGLVIRGMDLIEAADRYSRQGALKTPPADPDVRALWRWFRVALAEALAEAGFEVPERR